MKIKKRYVCKECGYFSNSWLGKCPECNSWNSLVEELIDTTIKNTISNINVTKPININEVTNSADNNYLLSEIDEINVFFGNGIIKGSVILLSGEPGVGKSTFLLSLVNQYNKKNILYFSGEESLNQIKTRYDRVCDSTNSLFISNISDIDEIENSVIESKPDICFIDSIQTIFSKNVDSFIGSVTQVKYCTQKIIEFSKTNNIVTFIVCHITKSGEIAGPKLMEHMVDVVLNFEIDYKNNLRILRSKKNRFGSTNEVLFFTMKKNGLELVKNIYDYIFDNIKDNENYIGKCKTVIVEGIKPFVVEVEALVVASSYPNPRRISESIDITRLNRIIAILDKHLNENFSNYDVYFNISGGIKTDDIGIDLAIALSIYSSKNKKFISNDTVFLGELSLIGKIYSTRFFEERELEAKRFGINNVICNNNYQNIEFLKNFL